MAKRTPAPAPKKKPRPQARRSAPRKEATAPATPLYFNEGVIFSALCFLAALLNFATQVVFRRGLLPGEFGALNATLGLVGLLGVPLSALNQTVTHQLARHHARAETKKIERLRAAARKLLEAAAVVSAVAALLFLFILGWIFNVTRFSLDLSALVLVWVSLGGTLSAAFCLGLSRFRLWGGLVLGAAMLRLILATLFTHVVPYAEVGLFISILTGLIILMPLFRYEPGFSGWLDAWRSFADRPFLIYLTASLSVALGLFLFTFADQIIAQRWFSQQISEGLLENWVQPAQYDSYQAAGLLGRALIWGTQPLLLVFFTQRSRRETPLWHGFHLKSLQATFHGYRLIVLYVALLLAGAVTLGLLRGSLSELFTGRPDEWTAQFIVRFAVAMVPIGLLQVLGTYFLAARRFLECYLVGGLGLIYGLLLYFAGRQPELLLAYMIGGASFALFGLGFYLIVKWSRSQP